MLLFTGLPVNSNQPKGVCPFFLLQISQEPALCLRLFFVDLPSPIGKLEGNILRCHTCNEFLYSLTQKRPVKINAAGMGVGYSK